MILRNKSDYSQAQLVTRFLFSRLDSRSKMYLLLPVTSVISCKEIRMCKQLSTFEEYNSWSQKKNTAIKSTHELTRRTLFQVCLVKEWPVPRVYKTVLFIHSSFSWLNFSKDQISSTTKCGWLITGCAFQFLVFTSHSMFSQHQSVTVGGHLLDQVGVMKKYIYFRGEAWLNIEKPKRAVHLLFNSSTLGKADTGAFPPTL